MKIKKGRNFLKKGRNFLKKKRGLLKKGGFQDKKRNYKMVNHFKEIKKQNKRERWKKSKEYNLIRKIFDFFSIKFLINFFFFFFFLGMLKD